MQIVATYPNNGRRVIKTHVTRDMWLRFLCRLPVRMSTKGGGTKGFKFHLIDGNKIIETAQVQLPI